MLRFGDGPTSRPAPAALLAPPGPAAPCHHRWAQHRTAVWRNTTKIGRLHKVCAGKQCSRKFTQALANKYQDAYRTQQRQRSIPREDAVRTALAQRAGPCWPQRLGNLPAAAKPSKAVTSTVTRTAQAADASGTSEICDLDRRFAPFPHRAKFRVPLKQPWPFVGKMAGD